MPILLQPGILVKWQAGFLVLGSLPVEIRVFLWNKKPVRPTRPLKLTAKAPFQMHGWNTFALFPFKASSAHFQGRGELLGPESEALRNLHGWRRGLLDPLGPLSDRVCLETVEGWFQKKFGKKGDKNLNTRWFKVTFLSIGDRLAFERVT